MSAAEEVPGPDLRLAGPALGAWLSALWALYLSPGAALALAMTAALLAALGWYATRRRAVLPLTVTTALIGVLLGVISGAVATAARTSARDAAPLADLARERVTVRAELVVSEDPRRGRGIRVRTWLVPARMTSYRVPSARTPATRLDVRVLVISDHPRWRGALPGQRVTVTGRLGPARGGDLRAATLSVSLAPRFVGPAPGVQRAAGSLRAGLQRAADPLSDEPGGLLPGLAIGDVSRMDPAVEEDFRATGMTHLTAVSGSNVAIIVGLVLLLTAWCRAGPVASAVVALVALVGFVILVRPSPSVLRAAAMGALALVALASGRPRAAVPGLAATVYALVVIDPELAGDLGFALSVLATAGLLLLAPRWRDALRRRGCPSGVAEALAVPVAAQVACAPVIAAMTGTVSLSAIPANLLAAPAVAPATVLGAASAAVSPLWPAGAEFLAWLGSWPAYWLVLVARWGAGLPGATAAWPGGTSGGLLLAAALAALLFVVRRRTARRVIAVGAAAALLGVTAVRTAAPAWPPADWVLVACDVGQGDTLALRVGHGQAVVVDAGPDPSAADRCLRRLGVTSVPLLVVSHFHADHIGGVAAVFRGREVASVAGPAYAEPAPARDAVTAIAGRHGAPMLLVSAGWSYRAGPVRIEVLGPERPQLGTRSDPNNNSVILRVRVPGLTMLLTGDAEIERQQAMLSGGEPVRADVLKVAHHGSSYQDPGFLAAVDPAVALVSVGVRNDYGHPNPSLLHRLAADGARVFRTDRCGDIAVGLTRGGVDVTCRGPEPGTRPR